MSAVMEVSEGLPVEGRPFEPPQRSRADEEPRYVAFLGSVITPDAAREREWTRWGGIDIHNPCLRYVQMHLRKGRITPVLKDTHAWINLDIWEKSTGKDASYFERPVPAGYVPPNNEYGNPSRIPPMMGKMALPGQQIQAILTGGANTTSGAHRAVVELTSLKGIDYNPQALGNGVVTDPEIWRIQRTIFPTYPALPILLDDIEQLLEAAKIHTLLRPVTDQYNRSLTAFRTFARAKVEQTHVKMRESGAKSPTGDILQYTDMDFVLLEQLGMERQDMNIRKVAADPTGDPEMREMWKQFLQLQIAEKQAIQQSQAEMAEMRPVVDANTMAAGPIAGDPGYPGYPGQSGYSGYSGEVVAAAAPTVKFYTCEHCGEEVKVAGKGFHVGRHCKVLHPKGE